jgi:hypothetical protein
VRPGESVTFSASASFSDRTTRDVTQEVTWGSDDERVLLVDGNGLVKGVSTGGASIRARLGSRESSRPVLVLTEGTARVQGTVAEAGQPGPIFGAVVEVSSGPATGLATTTDSTGSYKLYGVPFGTDIRVSKTGFAASVLNTGSAAGAGTGMQGLSFTLARSADRPDHSGAYTLEITSNCPASVGLQHVRVRTYSAVLRQTGRVIQITLGNAPFAVDGATGKGGGFSGFADDDDVQVSLDDYSDPWWLGPSYPSLAERLPDGTTLVISGTALLNRSAAGFTGTLDGWFTVYAAPLDPFRAGASSSGYVGCHGAHGFALRR